MIVAPPPTDPPYINVLIAPAEVVDTWNKLFGFAVPTPTKPFTLSTERLLVFTEKSPVILKFVLAPLKAISVSAIESPVELSVKVEPAAAVRVVPLKVRFAESAKRPFARAYTKPVLVSEVIACCDVVAVVE